MGVLRLRRLLMLLSLILGMFVTVGGIRLGVIGGVALADLGKWKRRDCGNESSGRGNSVVQRVTAIPGN